MEDLFKVGIITTTHGVHGEVKVYPTTDDMRRFKKLKSVILKTPKESKEMEIESVKFFKNLAILKFKGLDNMNDVEGLRNAELYVDRKNAVRLNKDEYFIADLIGIKVLSDDDKYKGTISDVLSGSANDVYVCDIDGVGEVLLPAIKECIKEVDFDEGVLRFHMMDGLI